MMKTSSYLNATRRIPAGETRSFMEIAAMAGRPGAARAAGRALSSCSLRSSIPWHRVVSSNGMLSKDPSRKAMQLQRLRREGARPRSKETILTWAQRIRARWVATYATRTFARCDDPRVRRWNSERVEPFRAPSSARARGFYQKGDVQDSRQPLPSASRYPPTHRGSKTSTTVIERIRNLDWDLGAENLTFHGHWLLPGLLGESECETILSESTTTTRFERTINMLPKGYGVGTYHYYREPLGDVAQSLRSALYSHLAPIASTVTSTPYEPTLAQFWKRCRRAGQKRSSSILICYGEGGINHPHRDIYGKVWFPFQGLVMLTKRGRDFEGGEFLLMDETAEGAIEHPIPVSQGDVVLFATRERFEKVGNRMRRIPMRHGMRPLTKGRRYGLGLVFHLAE